MLIQRMLAWFDRLVGFNSADTPGSCGASRDENFYELLGPRLGIVHSDGTMEIVGYFEVVHRYDATGKLLSRKLRRKMLKQGDKLVYGLSNIYARHRESLESIGDGVHTTIDAI